MMRVLQWLLGIGGAAAKDINPEKSTAFLAEMPAEHQPPPHVSEKVLPSRRRLRVDFRRDRDCCPLTRITASATLRSNENSSTSTTTVLISTLEHYQLTRSENTNADCAPSI